MDKTTEISAASLILPSARGLSSAEASTRLEEEGYNELPQEDRRGSLWLFFEIIREPMVFLIIGCGLIYLALGDAQEALMLLGFLALIIGITFYQERKAEKALRALRELSSPRAIVLRDGRKTRVPGRELVRDDVLFVSEGDRVAADGEVLAGRNFSVDESLLTGEAMPIAKHEKDSVYAGATAVKGSAVVLVVATGSKTQLGQIGRALQASQAEPTRLDLETRKLVRIIALVATFLCVLVVVVYASYRGSWLGGLLVGLTLAMAILPNELPAVLTIFMALGAWRLSKKRILTRRLSAIEALGTTTILCVDKTGTLTYNRMTVRKLVVDGMDFDVLKEKELPEKFHELLEFGMLATEQEPFDPIDRALKDTGVVFLGGTEHIHPEWAIAKQYPLSPDLMALSQVWRPRDGERFFVGLKGAPEAVADLCHLPEAARQHIEDQVRELAREGLRVLAVARGEVPRGDLPPKQHDIDFEFIGLVGFEDPLRTEVPQAITECRAAGIRVIIITGDHPVTALSVAKQAGIRFPTEVLTGSDLETLSDEELRERFATVSVCARITPQQKMRLVEALKTRGDIVAMTGDGVNDAPALQSASIGIAMGRRGTDVAREAADLVLLDDDFSAIVAAIKMGRRIYQNLQHAMSYLLAIHIPIAGLTVIPVLIDLPLILMPVHIAFLHLIIEPACSIAFEAEPEAADTMRQPPRAPHAKLFSREVMLPTLIQGGSVLAILLLVFVAAWRWGNGEADARSLAFTVLVVANLGLIIANLGEFSRAAGRKENKAIRWILIGTILLLAIVLYWQPLSRLFGFTVLHPNDLLLCLVAGIVSSLWFFVLRIFKSKESSFHWSFSKRSRQ